MPYLRVLGGAVLEDGAGVVSGPAGRRHPMALLAVLATAPARTLSRGKLVGLLWPDSPEKTVRNRLNTCVHHVRSALGKDVLVSLGDDLRLNPEVLSCDVCEFQEALEAGDHERAVGLYGGPLLDGFRLGGSSAAFEKRLDRERDRLRRRYREALESLAVGAESRGEPEVAARWWRQRAGEDPYDSRVVLQLMQSLEAAGNRAAALRTARIHAQLLKQEFGTEPSAELRALVEALESSPPGEAVMANGTGRGAGVDAADLRTFGAEAAPESEPAGMSDPAEMLEAGLEAPRHSPEGRKRRVAPSSRPPRRTALFAAPVAIGLLAAAAVAIWYLLGATGAEQGNASDVGDPSVAVLPFETIDGEEATPFTRGVHAGLLTRLSKIPQLAVISEASVERLQEIDEPLPQAAAAVGVGWILRGDVQQVGDEVQVNARLVDARRDRQVWAETYRTSLTAGGLFEVQGEIVRQIATALEIRLGPEEARRVAAIPTENTAAYELYLQAENLTQLPAPSAERMERRIELYGRALELDSAFAEGWARLAHAYVTRAWSDDITGAWADSALSAARRALELDPELAEGYAQLGNALWALGRDPDETVHAYRRALELQPSHAAAVNNLVTLLFFHGRLAEALRWADQAFLLSPNSASYLASLVWYNSVLGRDEVADAWLARDGGRPLYTVAFDVELFHRGRPARARPYLGRLSDARPDDHEVIRRRAALALYLGDWREARRKYQALGPGALGGSSPIFLGLLDDAIGLAFAFQQLGDPEEARLIAAEVMRATAEEIEGGRTEYFLRNRMAAAHLLLADTTRALDWLEEAIDAGFRDSRTLTTLPLLAPLRGDPRFRSLVDRIVSLTVAERRRVEEEGSGLPAIGGEQSRRAGRDERPGEFGFPWAPFSSLPRRRAASFTSAADGLPFLSVRWTSRTAR